jgi:lysophospholipase L1-like esterase
LIATALLAGNAAGAAQPAGAASGKYLALGDSVAFGYQPPGMVPPPNYNDPGSFVGYPEVLAQQLHVHVANAGCPGETTGSMLSVTAQSNGCENHVGGPGGYRTAFPLHVKYQNAQVDYALKYLARHAKTNLITIDIGANDVFVCQEITADHCTSPTELAAVAAQITTNLGTLFATLRDAGHYQGALVALSYYSLSYSDPAQVAGTEFLNAAIAAAALPYGGIMADGFGAFQNASAAFGGDPCAAGLLIKLPDGSCDVHPTLAGHELLAGAIAAAIGH